jgi:hypothetical protein
MIRSRIRRAILASAWFCFGPGCSDAVTALPDASSSDVVPVDRSATPDAPILGDTPSSQSDTLEDADARSVLDTGLGSILCDQSRPQRRPTDPDCTCVDDAEGRRGVCVAAATCISGGCQGGWCVATPQELGGGFSSRQCGSGPACAELARRYLANPGPSRVACFFQDGTLVTTGVVPVANCPAGSEGTLCGPGCAPCAGAFNECWGSSEQFPLGFCHDGTQYCSDLTSCPGTFQCLRPRNLAASGVAAPGQCVAPDRCAAIAAMAPDRFRCVR